MTDKLAEEILSQHLSPEYLALDGNWLLQPCIKAMQAYHEAKMKEEKAKKFYNKNTCVVCHQNYIDSANGFDTCDYCLNRIKHT